MDSVSRHVAAFQEAEARVRDFIATLTTCCLDRSPVAPAQRILVIPVTQREFEKHAAKETWSRWLSLIRRDMDLCTAKAQRGFSGAANRPVLIAWVAVQQAVKDGWSAIKMVRPKRFAGDWKGVQCSLGCLLETISVSTCGGKPHREFGLRILAMLRAGWIPYDGLGPVGDPTFRVYALPDLSVPIPDRCIADRARIVRSTPKPRIAIDRASLPTSRFPVFPSSRWAELSGLNAETAARSILLPLAEGAGASARKTVEGIARRATGVKVEKRRELVITFRSSPSVPAAELRLAEPWRGSLVGVPPSAGRVMRRHNGMRFTDHLSHAQWNVYRGPERGFRFDWSVWEMPDNDDGLWKRAPLSPFTDGQDIWVYHPAAMRGKTLELVRIDHEGGHPGTEPARDQDAAACFLGILLRRLQFHERSRRLRPES